MIDACNCHYCLKFNHITQKPDDSTMLQANPNPSANTTPSNNATTPYSINSSSIKTGDTPLTQNESVTLKIETNKFRDENDSKDTIVTKTLVIKWVGM